LLLVFVVTIWGGAHTNSQRFSDQRVLLRTNIPTGSSHSTPW